MKHKICLSMIILVTSLLVACYSQPEPVVVEVTKVVTETVVVEVTRVVTEVVSETVVVEVTEAAKETELSGEEVEFLDKELEAAVREAINKPDGSITDDDMAGLSDLGATNVDIQNLSGLEYATYLTHLDLSSTQVSDLTLLAGLTDLALLYLDSTQVSDLTPLAGLTKLSSLDLRQTQVSDLTPLAGPIVSI